mgnify:CR=1 FL=1
MKRSAKKVNPPKEKRSPLGPVTKSEYRLKLGPGGSFPLDVPGGYDELVVGIISPVPGREQKVHFNISLIRRDEDGDVEASADLVGFRRPPVGVAPARQQVGDEWIVPKSFPSKLQDPTFLRALEKAVQICLGVHVVQRVEETDNPFDIRDKSKPAANPASLSWEDKKPAPADKVRTKEERKAS